MSMKHNIKMSALVALLVSLFALGSCTNYFDMGDNIGSGGGIILQFGGPQRGQIDIQTRAYNLDYVDEHRVANMYVFIFDSNTQITSDVPWTDYMTFEVKNDIPQLNEDKRMLRYSCMTSNRDNDGDGIIDQDEIRWYMASIRQLIGMSIGSGLLKFDSRLYNRNSAQRESNDNRIWRQHVISSTTQSESSNNPTVVWGEEMTSTGALSGSYNSSTSLVDGTNRVNKWTVRCVRNLGTENETRATGYNLTEEPQSYVKYESNDAYAEDGALHSVTAVYLDDRALRAQSTIELPYTDENREINRLSKKFYIANTILSEPALPAQYNSEWIHLNVNNYVTDMGSSYLAGYCPEGYRLPNQKELVMMKFYYSGTMADYMPCRTYYSFGNEGTNRKENKLGWSNQGNLIFMVGNNQRGYFSMPRCVRDATLDELAAEGLL